MYLLFLRLHYQIFLHVLYTTYFKKYMYFINKRWDWDWDYILINYQLPREFIKKYKDKYKLNMKYIFLYQIFSDDDIEKHFENKGRDFWQRVSQQHRLPDEKYIKFQDKIIWCCVPIDFLSKNNLDVLKKFKTRLNWSKISPYDVIMISKKDPDCIDWEQIKPYKQYYSEEFRNKFYKELNWNYFDKFLDLIKYIFTYSNLKNKCYLRHQTTM